VREFALKLAQVVATNPDAVHVNFDWIEPARQLRIRIDQDEARSLGLSSQAVASVLNTVMSGAPVTQVRDDIYLVDVVARATDEERVSLATLPTLQVPLPNGQTVPLSQFATFGYEQEYPLVWRRDRLPTLTVQADVTPGTLPESVVSSP
jgi:multidrug efflux pump subunit AcrB